MSLPIIYKLGRSLGKWFAFSLNRDEAPIELPFSDVTTAVVAMNTAVQQMELMNIDGWWGITHN